MRPEDLPVRENDNENLLLLRKQTLRNLNAKLTQTHDLMMDREEKQNRDIDDLNDLQDFSQQLEPHWEGYKLLKKEMDKLIQRIQGSTIALIHYDEEVAKIKDEIDNIRTLIEQMEQ